MPNSSHHQSRSFKKIIFFIILASTLFLSGCSNFFKLYTVDEAPKKIENILSKDYNLKSYVYKKGKTLWIYTPLPFSFLHVTPAQNTQLKEIVNNVLATVARVLWSTEKGIDFYSALFVDTTSGMVIYIIGTTEDLKSFYFEKISIDEYSRRKIFDRTYMSSVIGDTTGAKFKYFDINKANFLADLITQRTKYGIERDYNKDKKDKKQKQPEVNIEWQTKEQINGEHLFTFLIKESTPEIEKRLIEEIKQVFRGYKFKDIYRIDIITPEHTKSLFKEDIFAKQ